MMTKRFALTILLAVVPWLSWAKTDRTYYTAAEMGQARAKIAKYDWAKNQVTAAEAAAARWIAMGDQELWNFVPPPEQLRALNVCFGVDCPVHGAEIFRKGGHYPWITDAARPFKVKCPVGGEEYPGNDFQPWNTHSLTDRPESGPGYRDLGAGWVDDQGRRYFFVGYYVFWHRWQREVIPAVSQLAQAYLLTGKPIYAHKGAVLLCRIAADYGRYDYPTQAYHNGQWPASIGGRILDYIWTTGTTTDFAIAYDALYPGLTGDQSLTQFLAAKGIIDARSHLEQRLLVVMARDIMRGFIEGNMGMHQQALATVAIVLDNQDPARGPTTREMADWIMTGPGDSEYLLWNGFYRDGHGGESSPGYSSGWVANYYQVARLLPRLGVDIWRNPKLKKMADIGLDLWIADHNGPSIGDNGSIEGSGRIGWSPDIQGPAFAHYGDPRFARALKAMGARPDSLFATTFDQAQVEAAVARGGSDLGLKTRNLGGYGLAILESGDSPHKRGVCMYYGNAAGGHGHRDRLNLELMDQRFPHPVLSDMGYPAHWLDKCAYWTGNTISHYGVVVDEGGQRTMNAGYLSALASAPGLQLMDASAEQVAYPGVTSVYRRTVAMVDISPTDYYLLDLFRVKGGWQHDYSFHGPASPEFAVAGGKPGPVQAKGTLAGEDVAFGARPPMRADNAGITVDLLQGRELIQGDRPYDEKSVEGWAPYYSNGILTRKTGLPLTFAIPPVGPGQVKVFLQVYDYNAGDNAVELTLGGRTQAFRWQPSGAVGPRWLSLVYDLAAATTTLKLIATQQGQSYVLLQSLAVATDLDAPEPRTWDPADSGFQYLFNVRRMHPEGTWSTTWRDPANNLALTLTMPQGCAQEVILADAEPELQPGAPKSLQYLLARNAAPAGQGDVASSYVNVIEPHVGVAKVGGVKRLRAAGAPFGAEGLAVTHGETRDLIHSALAPDRRLIWEGAGKPFTATGGFALLTLDAAGVRSATLMDGTELRYGDFALHAAPSPAGKVLSVDHGANTVALDTALPAHGYEDRVVILGNELHQTSYTIRGVTVRDGRTTLSFGDVLFLVGMARATGFDQQAGTVSTDTQLSGYGRVDDGRHQGRWLYNEDKSAGFRIAHFGGGKFTLEGVKGELQGIYRDVDGDGRRQLWISDIGPGDTFRIPSVNHVSRVRPGLYRLETMTPVTLALAR
jgi:hypothetical protein